MPHTLTFDPLIATLDLIEQCKDVLAFDPIIEQESGVGDNPLEKRRDLKHEWDGTVRADCLIHKYKEGGREKQEDGEVHTHSTIEVTISLHESTLRHIKWISIANLEHR